MEERGRPVTFASAEFLGQDRKDGAGRQVKKPKPHEGRMFSCLGNLCCVWRTESSAKHTVKKLRTPNCEENEGQGKSSAELSVWQTAG